MAMDSPVRPADRSRILVGPCPPSCLPSPIRSRSGSDGFGLLGLVRNPYVITQLVRHSSLCSRQIRKETEQAAIAVDPGRPEQN